MFCERTPGNRSLSCAELPWGDNYLIDVQYFHSSKMKMPNIIEKINNYGIYTHVGRFGKFKDSCWSFQKELRYRIILRPFGGLKPDKEKYNFKIGMKQKFIDVPIRQDAFENMQVILGPKHTESDLIIVNALLDAYNQKVSRGAISFLKIRNKA
jgi:hypothetical protein